MDRRILVIDDEIIIGEMLKEVLGSIYTILVRDNAFDGLSTVCEDIIMVFLDHKLPDANGIDVLFHIKQNHPSLPVVFMTGFGDEDVCRKAFMCGAQDYIRKPFCAEELRLKTDALMAYCDKVPLINDGVPAFAQRGITKVTDHIDRHYAEQLSLAEASRMSGLNTTYFCRYFRILTGTSFVEYLNNTRMQKAKKLLTDNSHSITDIALALGYNSMNYFTETFKKVNGCSPMQFRKELSRRDFM
jgi:YesN/AraC family two-component response regulator